MDRAGDTEIHGAAIVVGDVFVKDGERREVMAMRGPLKYRRVSYRVGHALLECRLKNFAKWARKADKVCQSEGSQPLEQSISQGGQNSATLVKFHPLTPVEVV